MNNEIQNQISRFLDFEENLEIDNLVYKNLSIWPVLRTAVFEEIFREKNLSLGSQKNNDLRKFSLNLQYLYLLFREILSFSNIFNKADVLLINNDPKTKIIDGSFTTKLVWGFTKALESDFRISILNTQSDHLNPDLDSINVSRILSLFSRIMAIFKGFTGWKISENYLDKSINKYFGIRLDWKRIYRDNFIRQAFLGYILRLIIKIKSPKIIIFSDNGSMSLVNKIANDRNIPTVDYQHAVLSDYYIIYNHNEGSSSLYKEHLSEYFFSWGEYRLTRYKDNYKCRVVGNAFFEESRKEFIQVKKNQKSLLLVSDGKYTRDELVDLAIQLSKKFKDFVIYYKLRPEEYENWYLNYPKEFSQIPNINVIDNDDTNLYYYLTLCSYVIGTNSTVLLEALPISQIIIYKIGWFFEMNDYIEDGLFLSADSCSEVMDLISSKKNANAQISLDSIFKEESQYLTHKNVKEIVEKKSFND
jgi:hypothetical protein